MTDTIARGAAALGNTYAGLLLVGVSDDRVVGGVKEKTIESVFAKGIMPSRSKGSVSDAHS
jgi:predicted HTH transcriptional regulator